VLTASIIRTTHHPHAGCKHLWNARQFFTGLDDSTTQKILIFPIFDAEWNLCYVPPYEPSHTLSGTSVRGSETLRLLLMLISHLRRRLCPQVSPQKCAVLCCALTHLWIQSSFYVWNASKDRCRRVFLPCVLKFVYILDTVYVVCMQICLEPVCLDIST
jgi:hypothetical protein